jgi:MFS family permease
MSAYRVCWWTVALSLFVVGLGAATVLIQTALLVLLCLFAVVGVLSATLFAITSPYATSWRRWRRGCRAILLACAAIGAAAGFAALAGLIALLAAVLMFAVSPAALHACRRGLGSVPRLTEEQLGALGRCLAYASPVFVPFELNSDLRHLTDDELAHAWHASEAAVSSSLSPRALERAVTERGRYLAEFERRHAGFLKAWLASEVEAPEDPVPSGPMSGLALSTIDWDELTGGQATDR